MNILGTKIRGRGEGSDTFCWVGKGRVLFPLVVSFRELPLLALRRTTFQQISALRFSSPPLVRPLPAIITLEQIIGATIGPVKLDRLCPGCQKDHVLRAELQSGLLLGLLEGLPDAAASCGGFPRYAKQERDRMEAGVVHFHPVRDQDHSMLLGKNARDGSADMTTYYIDSVL